jgi:hypothetical protein
MNSASWNGKSRPWLRWTIRLGSVAVGVAVAVISPVFLLVVLWIACLILYSRLPYRLRGLLFTTLFSRDLSRKKKPHPDD